MIDAESSAAVRRRLRLFYRHTRTLTRQPSSAETPSGTSTTTLSASASAAAPVLDDGRHAVFLTDLDLATSTVEFDLIQFLSGDEAMAAFAEHHPDEPEGFANDHCIVNDNPRLRTLRVVDDVEVAVLQTAESTNDARAIPSRHCSPTLPPRPCPATNGSGTARSG
jgi:hypothetical protein